MKVPGWKKLYKKKVFSKSFEDVVSQTFYSRILGALTKSIKHRFE